LLAIKRTAAPARNPNVSPYAVRIFTEGTSRDPDAATGRVTNLVSASRQT
jgi:hypothetical protein